MDEFEKQKLREMSNSGLHRRVVELENTVGKLQEELREQDHKFEVDKREFAQQLTGMIRDYYETSISYRLDTAVELFENRLAGVESNVEVMEEILEVEK